MNENKEASNILLKGIRYLIQQELKRCNFDRTFTGVIKTVEEGNLYSVVINNKTYEGVPSVISNLKVNDIVKVRSPQNQFSQIYIDGKII